MMKRKIKKIPVFELQPDELLLDVHNLPAFDKQQFEGRVEQPIPKRALHGLILCIGIMGFIFVSRLFYLQVVKYSFYNTKSEKNSLQTVPLFANRGVIYDRNNVELAWNTLDAETDENILRKYIETPGFANFLGYVSYPAKDSSGKFWQERTIGRDGIEKQYDTELAGVNGTKLVEVSVKGGVTSGGVVDEPQQGKNINLSIDSRMQSVLYSGIQTLATGSGFVGGAGVIMDIHTGEIYAMTSYPEYNPQILADGSDTATIQGYMKSKARPFLNRATEGLYTPGSIIKPFLALAALHEGVITPYKQILSTKEMKVPNPFKPGTFSIFKDNAAHGLVDMRHAIAVSSNIYFYQIGGGFGTTQKGLGIANIEKYSRMFGIGEKTGIELSGELAGTVPSVAWKAKHFPNDPWRIGDTYNTSIGQYGYQVTPLEMARAVAGIASRGTLVTPTLIKNSPKEEIKGSLPFTDGEYTVVHEGMLLDVTEGTARSLLMPGFTVAAKTGTAQIHNNTRVNSWTIGFFPYEKPRFAFAVLMEDGPKVTTGAVHALRPLLDYIHANPELLTQ